MGYFKQYISEEFLSFSVIIEDDDKVCYAYLLEENQIVSDVWLYNNIDSPEAVDWKNKDDLPFANPKKFIKNNISPFDVATSIDVKWGSVDGKIYAKIYASNQLLVKLERDAFPGWSTLVKSDGPLAWLYSVDS